MKKTDSKKSLKKTVKPDKDVLLKQIHENERQIKDLEALLEDKAALLVRELNRNITLNFDLDTCKLTIKAAQVELDVVDKELTVLKKKAERLVDTIHRQEDAYISLKEELIKVEEREASKFTLGEVLGFVVLTITVFIMVLLHVQ